MTVPGWLGDALAVVMIATALYCAARLAFPRLWNRPSEHDVNAVHLLMGVAMAGMLVPGLAILSAPVWETVFAAWALWFAIRIPWEVRSAGAATRGRSTGTALMHHLPHLVACCAMLDMYFAPGAVAPGGSGGSSGAMSSTAARYPTIALALAVFLVIYAILVADRTTALSTFRSTKPRANSGADVAVIAHATIGRSGDTYTPLWSRQVADCCHIAMSVTMAYLLVVML